MEFEWLNDSRTSKLPAPTKVTRICGNLTTSHWLKVRTLTEGRGRVQVAVGGRIGRCRCWVKLRRTQDEQMFSELAPIADMWCLDESIPELCVGGGAA